MKNKAKIRSHKTTLFMLITFFWILPTQESLGTTDPGTLNRYKSVNNKQIVYENISKCGGLSQESCRYSYAIYLGNVSNPKPRSAFVDPRNGGEYWRCPVDFPRRTAYPVTDQRACATKKLVGEKLSPAEYLGKVTNPKPDGAFIDLQGGGEYWQCPTGFVRNITPVDQENACVIKGNACNDGLIEVKMKIDIVEVAYCMRKNECGGPNQRECLRAESSTPCKSGLVIEPEPKGGANIRHCVTPAKSKCIETLLRTQQRNWNNQYTWASAGYIYTECQSTP